MKKATRDAGSALLSLPTLASNLNSMSALAKRSRKGCWTCRERHKKCDERRPYCNVCEKSGRACAGYGVRLAWATSSDGGSATDSGFLQPGRGRRQRVARVESEASVTSPAATRFESDTSTASPAASPATDQVESQLFHACAHPPPNA